LVRQTVLGRRRCTALREPERCLPSAALQQQVQTWLPWMAEAAGLRASWRQMQASRMRLSYCKS
jgi:hypothetical protein